MKRIRLHSLGENSNISLLAQQIVEKCKLIHPNRIGLIEDILRELREKKTIEDRSVSVERKANGNVSTAQGLLVVVYVFEITDRKQNEATVAEVLENCLERIYDESKSEKLAAVQQILKLAKLEENLDILLQNGTLLLTPHFQKHFRELSQDC